MYAYKIFYCPRDEGTTNNRKINYNTNARRRQIRMCNVVNVVKRTEKRVQLRQKCFSHANANCVWLCHRSHLRFWPGCHNSPRLTPKPSLSAGSDRMTWIAWNSSMGRAGSGLGQRTPRCHTQSSSLPQQCVVDWVAKCRMSIASRLFMWTGDGGGCGNYYNGVSYWPRRFSHVRGDLGEWSN